MHRLNDRCCSVALLSWRLRCWLALSPSPLPAGFVDPAGALAPCSARIGRPRLSLIMSLLFIGLSIPILIFILIYNYNRNSAGMVSILNDAVAQTSQAGVERTHDLIESTESPLRFIAEVAAADPQYFRTDQSNDLLYRALTSACAYRRRLCQLRGWLSSRRHPHRRGPQTKRPRVFRRPRTGTPATSMRSPLHSRESGIANSSTYGRIW